MHRTGVVVFAITAVALVAAPAAGAASASAKKKEVSVVKYAKAVCGASHKVSDARDSFTDGYNALPVDDLATFQTQAIALGDTLVNDVDEVQNKLKRTYPRIDDGKLVSKLFVSSLEEMLTEMDATLEKFRAADAASVAFVADISVFEVSLSILDTKLGDPFGQVEDQELLEAFKDEKSCKDVVTIYGS